MKTRRIYFAPDEPPAGGEPKPGGQGEQRPGGATPPPSFETWLEGQTDDVKALYTAHSVKLENTVKATRQERDDLKGQLAELGKTLEKGSAAEKQLGEISGKLDEANRRADFFETAAKPEVGLLDVGAAWLIVQAGGVEFTDARGNIKLDALKEKHPILFGKPTVPRGNGGNGTDAPPSGKTSVDDLIRSKAGIR